VRVSFEGLAQAFLEDAKANVRDTTFKDYRGNLNRHLLPWFKGWKARYIRRADPEPARRPIYGAPYVESFRAHLLDSGIGRRTVNKCLTLLGSLFLYAIRREWLETNPPRARSSAPVHAVATIWLRRTSSPLARSESSWRPPIHAGA
jgi:hypothetical protein